MYMKKTLSLILSVVMVAGTMASCAKVEPAPVSGATLASSDAAAYTDLLEDRLGYAPENVVLGIGSSAEYGVDMTDFENDGYVIRTVGDNTVIFGKTETGLDMAVRKYANAVKNGVSADEIYHEGYRVERLTIAGRDISEYTVYYPAGSNENVKFAVSELVRLVKQATGVTLTAVEGDPVSPAISFAVSNDESLRDEGYVYTVTDDGIVFEHAEVRGASAAVYRFLQNECGWDCLIYGDSFLNEADHIDIPAGTNATETPAFDHYRIYNPYNTFKTDRKSPTVAQDGYNTNIIACHGLQNNYFFDEMKDFSSQPCYTDEDLYEICRDNVESYIAARYGDPGFKAVDIAAYDTSDYCFCDTCMEMFIEEGGNAGAVVRFANKLSEEMNEKYPGLVYLIFGYQGTNEPPKKAVPNDMVYVTYCFDLNCSNHTIDGKSCSNKKISMGRCANEYAKWFEGWCDITDNICVWYYTLGTALQAYTVIDNIYDDYRYFAEHNVKGLFLETENCGEFGIKRIENQLEYEMIWNTDMTREEFRAYYEKLLRKEYGPGWSLVADYVEKWEYSQDIMDCWQGWGWALIGPWDKRYSTTFYRENFDEFCTLIETALSMTESKYQEDRLNRLYVTVLYMGCYSSYYHAWLEGDTERIAVLSERYDRSMEIVRSLGYDPTNLPTITGGDGCVHYAPTLEEAAWSDWVEWYDDITGQPLPDDAPSAEGRGA
ncbi:MAG: DUF4838 domain-containing protein [Ruminococcaceae bacterium]|nr:DUF4838 domain-containing protein [Oscillospiraceae bacterium]